MLFGIVGASPYAWAHSGSLDEHEKQAIAVFIAFGVLIWLLAGQDERRDRRLLRDAPRKRRQSRSGQEWGRWRRRRQATADAMDTIRRVLMIVAHPDDAESWAGGTVANFAREGKSCAYVVVTSGEKGSSDRTARPDALRKTREREQLDAAWMLGVDDVQFLRYPDCEVEDTRRLRLDITRQIRRFEPDVVIAQNPARTYNLGVSHRDHRVVGGVVLD